MASSAGVAGPLLDVALDAAPPALSAAERGVAISDASEEAAGESGPMMPPKPLGISVEPPSSRSPAEPLVAGVPGVDRAAAVAARRTGAKPSSFWT